LLNKIRLVNSGTDYLPNVNGTVCDYLHTGQTGWKTYDDCDVALCKSGTCTLGSDGDRCFANYQCQHSCSSKGVCRTGKNAIAALSMITATAHSIEDPNTKIDVYGESLCVSK